MSNENKEIKEWLKVIEIADMIGVSKVSVYNKIKTLNSDILQGLQKKEKGITYFHLKAVNIISELFNPDNTQPVDDEISTEEDIPDNEYVGLYISELKGELKSLKEQMQTKDIQISEANERLKQAHKLIENNQILLKDKPKQDIFLLEEHFQDLDTKLEEVKNKMADRKEQQNKKSFFSKMFKRTN